LSWITRKPEVGRLPVRGRNFQFDHLGISGERIRANNKGVVFHPYALKHKSRSKYVRYAQIDFAPLKIVVEQVSPAMEVDGIEMGVLQEKDKEMRTSEFLLVPRKT
jgi:hypothetical protein